jgi:hypothetical protein
VRLVLESTGEVVDLAREDGAPLRCWVWTGTTPDGQALRVYVSGFNVPDLAAQAPEGAEVEVGREIPLEELQ